MVNRYPVHQCALFGERGLKGLCDSLWISSQHLKKLAAEGADAYYEWDEEKSTGGFRHIEAPRLDLKRVQRRLANLMMRVEPPEYLFCPVKRRDFLQNAKQHSGARTVWTIDIESYFQNTLYYKINIFFRERLNCAGDLANLLSDVTTVNGHLATGSPASPILAYFANEPMWNDIAAIVKRYDCRLTIYMDDLTVSGQKIPYELKELIKKAISRSGFRAHKECLYSDRAAFVTGAATGSVPFSLPHDFFKRRRLKMIALRAASTDQKTKIEKSLAGMDQLKRLAIRRASAESDTRGSPLSRG